jgi:hypothetical protein
MQKRPAAKNEQSRNKGHHANVNFEDQQRHGQKACASARIRSTPKTHAGFHITAVIQVFFLALKHQLAIFTFFTGNRTVNTVPWIILVAATLI